MAPLTILWLAPPAAGLERLAAALGAERFTATEAPLGEALGGLKATGGEALVLWPAALRWPEHILASLLETHAIERNALTLLTTDASFGEGPGIRRDHLGRILALASAPGAEAFGGALACDLARIRARSGDLPEVVAALTRAGELVGGTRASGDERGEDCPLCAMGAEPNPESGLLIDGSRARLAVDRPGFNSGQLICFPRRHITSMVSLDEIERRELSALLRVAEEVLSAVYGFDALNIGANSRSGEHLSMRIIPRWAGDLNFLPLVSGLKPVPESPVQAWQRLMEVMR